MAKTEDNGFVQSNSPNGGFLASSAWRAFQEAAGRNVFHLEEEGFSASIIEHRLPLVGKYFYVPRGPIISRDMEHGAWSMEHGVGNGARSREYFSKLIELAEKNGAGWIRVDPASDKALEIMRKSIDFPIQKAPHDMQPKEIFLVDISKSEEDILTGMKPKTRYNIRLAEKKNVKICYVDKRSADAEKYLREFLRLVAVTAKRDGIVSHPGGYYRKMFAAVPSENMRLYVARYGEKVIAANLVVLFGDTATYLHGASDNENRNLMAPYLLQWQQMKDAKAAGCSKYDFGGVSIAREPGMAGQDAEKKGNMSLGSWAGITKFKIGFSPKADATVFPGSYDIVVDKKRYSAYRILSSVMPILKRIKKST
ncbi:MAG: aminoacyltransferase [Candidatus Moranbacteria bacterium]|nr:aminoacyltransferase [Candidatus Moranbacteria bacterium]